MDWCTRSRRILLSSLIAAIALAIAGGGCISDQGTFYNLEFRGYVLRMSDSTAVPGALIVIDRIIEKRILGSLRTDADGYYDFKITFPSGGETPLEFQVTVADMDGDTNGVFVSQDTMFYGEGVQIENYLVYEVDFYVEMVEDTTSGS